MTKNSIELGRKHIINFFLHIIRKCITVSIYLHFILSRMKYYDDYEKFKANTKPLNVLLYINVK